ncbi:MAG: mechanosensitive ion channel family protein, partial [Alphaproteobacteria bacterium]|nr:mechanosensitive ion channel family protein [Alphaproteobacteria bacterium]
DLFNFDDASIGGRMARAALDIALTVFVGYLAWGLLKAVLMRHMPTTTEEQPGGDGGGTANTTRLGTVLPLFMRTAQVSIVVMVVMVILSALGVNIGPLLAGAGVIGIAVGFGAQTLVRDLVSGLFFLIDDAFRRGEYIDIGKVRGTVERINVRSLVLRHHLGPLHTVPYGEIKYLTNYSRDWMIMKLEFRVGYDTDVDKVKKIFKKIGQEMLEHPEMGQDFIEPFKSQGVKAMEDSAMIVRGKFMAKPGKQFSIRKEIYTRVQKAFQEAGIQFAHRRVTVELPPDLELPPEKKKEIAEAAGAAALLDDGDKKRGRG